MTSNQASVRAIEFAITELNAKETEIKEVSSWPGSETVFLVLVSFKQEVWFDGEFAYDKEISETIAIS